MDYFGIWDYSGADTVCFSKDAPRVCTFISWIQRTEDLWSGDTGAGVDMGTINVASNACLQYPWPGKSHSAQFWDHTGSILGNSANKKMRWLSQTYRQGPRSGDDSVGRLSALRSHLFPPQILLSTEGQNWSRRSPGHKYVAEMLGICPFPCDRSSLGGPQVNRYENGHVNSSWGSLESSGREQLFAQLKLLIGEPSSPGHQSGLSSVIKEMCRPGIQRGPGSPNGAAPPEGGGSRSSRSPWQAGRPFLLEMVCHGHSRPGRGFLASSCLRVWLSCLHSLHPSPELLGRRQPSPERWVMWEDVWFTRQRQAAEELLFLFSGFLPI